METQIVDRRDVKMNQIEIFSNDLFGDVRVVKVDGQPWFIGKDITEKLGYQNGSRDINRHVDAEDMSETTLHDGKQNRKMKLINESGLYGLILSSDLPNAKLFKRWVTNDILPSIRQNGGYIQTSEEDDEEIIMAKALIVAQKTIENKNKKIHSLEQETLKLVETIENQKPKLEYLDEILSCENAMLVTNIAFDYGLSARALNKILCEERIQRKVRSQYILYAEYLGKGYTRTETEIYGGKSRTQTLWTQKGRMLIHKVLGFRGIKPLMDLELAEA